jgi:hypothetical protein
MFSGANKVFMIERAESLGAKIVKQEHGEHDCFMLQDMPGTPMHNAWFDTAFDAAMAFTVWHALIRDIQGSTPNDQISATPLGAYMAACAAILAMPAALGPDFVDNEKSIAYMHGYNAALEEMRAILATHGITKDS